MRLIFPRKPLRLQAGNNGFREFSMQFVTFSIPQLPPMQLSKDALENRD
jgi:hypothetical protein